MTNGQGFYLGCWHPDKEQELFAEARFEEWWKLLPTGAYPEENKELFRHAYTSGWRDRESLERCRQQYAPGATI